jgi:tRNA-Thr(GGU) m(6)t(6)A37 methyltransferase TsaA
MKIIPSENLEPFTFLPIGHIHSPFREKFGLARQSMMMSEARGVLKLVDQPLFIDACRELSSFSHIWIVFVFHKNIHLNWTPTSTVPRLEQEARVGTFASRSPHRPNPIGISAVKLEHVDTKAKGGIEIHLSGIDFLDGTPVLDIKPYLPYADSIDQANSGWAREAILKYKVSFSPEAYEFLEEKRPHEIPNLKELVIQMLELDPRPTSQRAAHPIESPESEGKVFAFRLSSFDIHWKIQNHQIYVTKVYESKDDQNELESSQ